MTELVLGAILARKGSKGITDKNLAPLAGKPLLVWTIEAAKNAETIDDIYVSSDSQDILHVATQCGVNCIDRPCHLASDDASSASALFHLVTTILSENKHYQYLVLLQPTSPLRNGEDIDNAFQEMKKQQADSVIAVVKPDCLPHKSFQVNHSGFLQGIANNDYPFMGRQQLPQAYFANGSIYIIETGSFLANRSFLTEKTAFYEMSREKSLDIDTPEDLVFAERFLQ